MAGFKKLIPQLLLLSLLCWYVPSQAQGINKLGVLDLSGEDFLEIGKVKLEGNWEIYWDQLLYPQDFEEANQPKPDYIAVPGLWNNTHNRNSSQGYATYRFQVLLDNTPELLALEIPNVYTSYRLWVNSQLIASNGVVGTSSTEATAEWKPLIKMIPSSDTLDIICQVANFHHDRGGMHKSIVLGTHEVVSSVREGRVVANMFLTGGLIVLGAFFIVFFILRGKERATLYFGLFCLLWAIRSVFSNIYLISSLFDHVNWAIAIRIEYLSLYGCVMVGMLFIHVAFSTNPKSLLKYSLVIINTILIMLTLVLSPLYFTRLLPAYQFFIAINLLYAIVIVIKAIINKQKEAWFTAASVMLGIALFVYEMVMYILVLDPNYIFLNMAYLVIFFLNSLVLAYRFVGAYKKVTQLESEPKDPIKWLRGV